MKPFPNRTSTFQRIRLSPDHWSIHRGRDDRLERSALRSSLRSAEALRPAMALPVALGGRDSTGYYGLSVPLPALVISRPILTEAGKRFRRRSCRKFCAALGALSTP